MPILPDKAESQVFLQLNQGPGLLFDILGAGAFQAIVLALRLGIFDALGDGSLAGREMAHKTGTDERGITILLDFLESCGYVRSIDGRYRNTALTKKWLLSTSPTNLADMVRTWNDYIFRFWGEYIEDSIRNGKPPMTLYEWFDKRPDSWRIFNSFEMAAAHWVGENVVNAVVLPPKARRLLDIGGGHGLYSIMFCRKYPQLSATIFDSHEPLNTARENINVEKMGDRISVKEGDFWVDAFGQGNDVALLFNIIHHHTPEKNVELLRKIRNALNPGGVIVIFDQLSDMISGPFNTATIRFFALVYLAMFGGRTYSRKEVRDWLGQVGFVELPQARQVPTVVVAKRPR